MQSSTLPHTVSDAYTGFLSEFPRFTTTLHLDELRRTDFSRLDEQGHVYLDYTGGGLYAESQVRQHMEMLCRHVYGNPHSHNPTSTAMTERVEQTRACILDYFNASPDEYVVIFTPNASGALKLVGESYPFTPGGIFAIATDDHNSVNGIREYARARAAAVCYLPLTMPELRLDMPRVEEILAQADAAQPNLLAFPAQSNYSGVQHPLTLVARARELGWDVLLDCAAFAPSNRLDLGRWQPDFATFSFYKVMGYPTGVGALLARRTALAKLRRPWFAGGTIRIVSVSANKHFFADDEAAFEDGTVNYLTIPAVEMGLHLIQQVGVDAIHERVQCLTGWLLSRLNSLRHANGRALVRIHGPTSLEQRGGTITMSFFDVAGDPVPGQWIEQFAGEEHISLRTGCFCNPGAGETTFELPLALMHSLFSFEQVPHFQELVALVRDDTGKDVSGVRISVGLASNFADVFRFIEFAAGLLDTTVAELLPRYNTDRPHRKRDTA